MEDYSFAQVSTTGETLFPAASIPASIISAVIAAPTENAIGIAGFVRSAKQILKADVITFNTRSLLQLENVSDSFIAIVAKDLYIEVPPIKSETAKIARAPDSLFGDLTGATGPTGGTGTSSNQEDGAHGGTGGSGIKGGTGVSLKLPDLYIFFERINTGAGNPATGGLLTVFASGIPGGKGGAGGVGGAGGAGATGSPGSSTKYSCSAGPGIGGNGGNGGSGGQGGDGGVGGKGGSVFLVGPKNEWKKAAFFEILQGPGKGGDGGEPGQSGPGGSPGGGGSAPWPCNGRSGGSYGSSATPANLGRGSRGVDGEQGVKGLIDRANTDLF